MDNISAGRVWLLSSFAIVLLAFVSSFFTAEVPYEIFFMFPTALSSWYGSKRTGIVVSTFSAVALLAVEISHQTFDPLLVFTYFTPCFVSLALLAILITDFRAVHRFESLAADTDDLTGINNTRGFYTELTAELLRSVRYEHPFTLAFLDVDDFKAINDSLGHAEGDKLLREVASCLSGAVRSTDVVGRLGGDEFACLMPESGPEEARAAFTKVLDLLQSRMAQNRWGVGFSVGVVTFERPPDDIKEALLAADDLMYSAKREGKNKINYLVWSAVNPQQ